MANIANASDNTQRNRSTGLSGIYDAATNSCWRSGATGHVSDTDRARF